MKDRPIRSAAAKAKPKKCDYDYGTESLSDSEPFEEEETASDYNEESDDEAFPSPAKKTARKRKTYPHPPKTAKPKSLSQEELRDAKTMPTFVGGGGVKVAWNALTVGQKKVYNEYTYTKGKEGHEDMLAYAVHLRTMKTEKRTAKVRAAKMQLTGSLARRSRAAVSEEDIRSHESCRLVEEKQVYKDWENTKKGETFSGYPVGKVLMPHGFARFCEEDLLVRRRVLQNIRTEAYVQELATMEVDVPVKTDREIMEEDELWC